MKGNSGNVLSTGRCWEPCDACLNAEVPDPNTCGKQGGHFTHLCVQCRDETGDYPETNSEVEP